MLLCCVTHGVSYDIMAVTCPMPLCPPRIALSPPPPTPRTRTHATPTCCSGPMSLALLPSCPHALIHQAAWEPWSAVCMCLPVVLLLVQSARSARLSGDLTCVCVGVLVVLVLYLGLMPALDLGGYICSQSDMVAPALVRPADARNHQPPKTAVAAGPCK